MAGLNKYIAIGRISKVTFKTIERDNKNKLDICTITVPVNNWKPARVEGDDPTESTIWCELTAFGYPDRMRSNNTPEYNRALAWSTQFHEKDVVSISGTPEIRTYLRGDGTPGASMILDDPEISKVIGTANINAEQVAKEPLPF